MGCVRTFLVPVFVAALAATAYLCRERFALPNWYWEARLPDTVEALDAADTTALKRALFGGEPWLIQCYSGLPYSGQHLPAPFRMHPTFLESLGPLRGLVRAGTLDCEHVLPSNKTLVAKLGLVRRTQPLLIFASGGGNPKQVPANAVSSAYGITAWVKPKAEPKILSLTSQQQFRAACGGRRACLLTTLDKDSMVLQQIAAKFRSLEVVSIPESSGAQIRWGRGEEVGETLEEEEARHIGKRISFLKPDPDAPPKKQQANPARLLRGFNGAEDMPSISLFLSRALETEGDTDFMRIALPSISAPKKAKKAVKNDNAEVQARRARKRAATKAREEAEAAERAAKREEKGKSDEQLQREREQRQRERMAREEEQAGNIIEEVDDEEEDDASDEEPVEIISEDEEAVDLDF
mmetsp:Transcript_2694/g.5724  ORF Transcript_2694/g.5724 Transcript_2694/m.5724 type:complete len:409 (-) Transcript_2694:441-1667(-)